MTLEPDDFWSFYEWFVRPNEFLESALLQGIVLIVLAVVLGLMIGYLIAAVRYGPGEGFYSMARVIKELLTTDLPGTSPRRVIALARLAFKEAIRRRILFVVGLFAVIIMFAGWFLNDNSDNPARLYISFALTATNYLILALALFISAFSIPEDVKNRTIYTIVTKPVRPSEIVLGRLLGFVAVGTAILVPMGVLSYFFVTRSINHTHYEVADFDEETGIGETDFVQNHRHTFEIAEGESDGLTNMVRGHQHVVTRSADNEFTIGKPAGALRARIPSYGSILFLDRHGDRQEEGVDIGRRRILRKGRGTSGISGIFGVREKRSIEHGYIEGGTLGAAIYTFSGVTPERYQDEVRLDMAIRAYRSWKGNIERGIEGTYTLKNPDNKTESNPIKFTVEEYQVVEKTIPFKIEGTLDTGEGTEGAELDLFKDLVNENGEVQLIVRCQDDQQYLGMTKSGIYLRPDDSTFAFSFFKAYCSIWLQMTMVMAFGIMFSTFLSGPVAMIASSVCVLLGFAAEQIYYTRENISTNTDMGGGPIESLVRLLRQDAMTTTLDVEPTTALVIKKADAAIVYCLEAIASALPNLPKMVETAEYVASGFDVFNALLARHAVATFGYCVLAFFISYFFLKSREIAA